MELFGYNITKRVGAKDIAKEKEVVSFTPKPEDDGVSSTVAAGGYYGQYVDLDGTASSNDRDLIIKYREASQQPECDSAISDIVDAAIASSSIGAPAELILNKLDQPDSIKKQISEEFGNVLSLYKFNKTGENLFRKWYVDGRIYFHVIIDDKNPKRGIIELRPVESLFMKKIKEVKKVTDAKTDVAVQKIVNEYYVYSEDYSGSGAGVQTKNSAVSGVKISKEAIINVSSGLLDATQKRVVSYLHKALKPVNQLRMMEDALVMYRVARAPERRIFYIDVGNLPKGKAEEYVQGIMNKYRNKLVYDASTGDIKDDRRHMSMLEDFWLPRREGGRGTEITTLPGGENLGQIDDILFFQKKLYKTLNVPVTRLDSDDSFNIGRASEISRDEVKFQKFVDRIRKKFSTILLEALRIQLILKGVISQNDWQDIAENIAIDFVEDNYFAELKENEILKERIDMLDSLSDHIGKFYSTKWIRNNILRQTDEDIERINVEISDEGEESDEGGDEDEGKDEKDLDLESVQEPIENIMIDEESEKRAEELHEAQIKMIDSMSKVLVD
jgi:hypothetical protein|tara:strand:+ start:141 stop:1814 length:1674 start_codon:yes stop_codon:yes gene_type:complete